MNHTCEDSYGDKVCGEPADYHVETANGSQRKMCAKHARLYVSLKLVTELYAISLTRNYDVGNPVTIRQGN